VLERTAASTEKRNPYELWREGVPPLEARAVTETDCILSWISLHGGSKQPQVGVVFVFDFWVLGHPSMVSVAAAFDAVFAPWYMLASGPVALPLLLSCPSFPKIFVTRWLALLSAYLFCFFILTRRCTVESLL